MPRRFSKKAVETLEFRGALILIGVVAVAIVYFALFAGHRPRDDASGMPRVAPGELPGPDRR